MSVASDSRLPPGMLLLGWSGLLPFAGAIALALAAPQSRALAVSAFIAHGAVILSFPGGARWGSGLITGAAPLRFVDAVLPSLIGFAALVFLHNPPIALGPLAAGFAIWLVCDLRDPTWSPAYRRMRLGISVAVLVLHALWLAVQSVLSDSPGAPDNALGERAALQRLDKPGKA
jgi:hypothetical protein